MKAHEKWSKMVCKSCTEPNFWVNSCLRAQCIAIAIAIVLMAIANALVMIYFLHKNIQDIKRMVLSLNITFSIL